ncbi:MAG: wyosine [tRNA(Phe)-imidazoG37] synthetase (radical SAM superfamily) [Myxococcota bacterium]|jgi:wyosine [tRNA(Phe)-imidazoG37] synthetase (radical SAM superfamily)
MAESTRQLDFTDHSRQLANNRYVYAVVSRRSQGLSIGINLNPDKVCNFACPYCQVDRTIPGGDRAVDLEVLSAELSGLLTLFSSGTLWSVPPFDTAAEAHRRVNDIAFAGDGEPTAAREFAGAVAAVAAVRDSFGLSDVAIHLLTNATLFHRPKVIDGLTALDAAGGEIWAKLDAGTAEWFALIDGTTLPFERVLRNLSAAAKARPIVLQCMFHAIDGVGPDDAEVTAWAGRISDLLAAGGMIRLVQVYSVARKPADRRVTPLPRARLEEIAAAARSVVAVHGATTTVAVY